MAVVLVVNSAPYGSEGPFNAVPLTEAPALRDEHVGLFLKGDAVWTAKAGQVPRGVHASLQVMLGALPEKGAEVTCCGTCCATRGRAGDLLAHAQPGTIHDLAAAVARSARVISF